MSEDLDDSLSLPSENGARWICNSPLATKTAGFDFSRPGTKDKLGPKASFARLRRDESRPGMESESSVWLDCDDLADEMDTDEHISIPQLRTINTKEILKRKNSATNKPVNALQNACRKVCTIDLDEICDSDDTTTEDSDENIDPSHNIVFDPFEFIRNLPPLTPNIQIKKRVMPPRHLKKQNITLVLDLDETLVHCSVTPFDTYSEKFDLNFGGDFYEVYVKRRPHVMEFLHRVSKIFEVVVFTASHEAYAETLLGRMDPGRKLVPHRLFRDSCIEVDGNYVKDLTVVDRDLSKTIIIDNSIQAFGFQLDNGIPVTSWFGDEEDTELLQLATFLEDIARTDLDVREILREKFMLYKYIEVD